MKNHQYIQQQLKQQLTNNSSIEYFSTIDSTNNYLLKKDFMLKYYFCYADTQTRGKGRRDNKWFSYNKK